MGGGGSALALLHAPGNGRVGVWEVPRIPDTICAKREVGPKIRSFGLFAALVTRPKVWFFGKVKGDHRKG